MLVRSQYQCLWSNIVSMGIKHLPGRIIKCWRLSIHSSMAHASVRDLNPGRFYGYHPLSGKIWRKCNVMHTVISCSTI